MRIVSHIFGGIAFVFCALLVFMMFYQRIPWPEELRDLYENSTLGETGASNIVSAIYLGYRAYDTLGETIVLYIAVAGTLYMIKMTRRDDADSAHGRYGRQSHRRTGIIRVITAKLGPAILVFGLYIMAFGYNSPGGGFQGGAVVASGIVILGISYLENGLRTLAGLGKLKDMEKLLFALLVACFFLGIPASTGFLANPFAIFSAKPVIYISLLNIVIGLKVGVSIGLLSLAMLIEDSHE